ncbi:multicopper oxidase domain-containing protein [Nocardioides sp. Soil774]|uniref:multicopper oxidase domain-containing protein n=1 Tax=Nocardioides sp. Soil774 TaxID=1736408 RepID=UPI00138F33B6|nr:multicopper oxidase domain-containing protein [Nocardioides sp. Soil774]
MGGTVRQRSVIGLAVAAWCAAALVAYDVTPLTIVAGTSSPAARAEAASGGTSATIVINRGDASKSYSTPLVTVSGDGTLSVTNLDVYDHTVTSIALAGDGTPLFDVKVLHGTTVAIPAVDGLASGSYDFYCRFHPNMRGTLVVDRSGGGTAPEPVAFDQPLVIPSVLSGPHVRLRMREAGVRILPTGPLTRMWTFGGTWPGPTITRPAGRATSVTFVNALPKRAGSMTVHLHGDHHDPVDDGQPTQFLIPRGAARTYYYPLTYGGNPEPSSFFWYHDHRMDHTARNNWRGLQGMFLVSDAADRRLHLPTGVRDVPLMVADRSFGNHNRLANPFATAPAMVHHGGQMFFVGPSAPPNDATTGTHVLVNGRFLPHLDVTATRYRLRLLNASSASAYAFALSDGRPLIQIGTGNGLLPRPVAREQILLGPAQRADVLVDFHGEEGTAVTLRSVPRSDGSAGTGTRIAPLMEFRVNGAATDDSVLPTKLPAPELVEPPRRVSKTWTFDLTGTPATGSAWTINGRPFDPHRVDYEVPLGVTQRWRLRNTSEVTHYVHIHAGQWRTLLRDGKAPPPWERGLEDTWRLDPGEVVEVATRFTDYTGPFMIHCHMLDHEDHGMMARFDVVR